MVFLTSISVGFTMAYSVVALPFYGENLVSNKTNEAIVTHSEGNQSNMPPHIVSMDSDEISWFGMQTVASFFSFWDDNILRVFLFQ